MDHEDEGPGSTTGRRPYCSEILQQLCSMGKYVILQG
jgi:hypothetical protein